MMISQHWAPLRRRSAGPDRPLPTAATRRRALIAGLAAVAAALPSLALAATLDVQTIVFSEDPAPGTVSAPYGYVDPQNAQINEAGQIAFKTEQGIFRYTPGLGTELITAGGTDPATGEPYRIGPYAGTYRLLEDGDVVFTVGTGPSFNTQAVYRSSGTGAGLRLTPVIRQGDPLSMPGDPAGAPSGSVGQAFDHRAFPEVAGDGSLVDAVGINPLGTAPDDLAVMKDGEGRVVLSTDTVLPSGKSVWGIQRSRVQTNANGTILAEVFTSTQPFNPQPVLVRIKDGVIEELTDGNGWVPGYDLNDNDEVAYVYVGRNTEVFVNDGTTTRKVQEFGGGSRSGPSVLDLNDAGQVVLAGNSGVYFDDGPVQLAQLFDFQVQGVNLNDNGTAGVLYRGIEALGDPIFETRLGIMDSLGNLTEIARVGDQIEVAPGDFRTITQLTVTASLNDARNGEFYNDAGEFLFWALFAAKDGNPISSGLFLFDSRTAAIPLPAGAWLLLAGGGALAGLRRRASRAGPEPLRCAVLPCCRVAATTGSVQSGVST